MFRSWVPALVCVALGHAALADTPTKADAPKEDTSKKDAPKAEAPKSEPPKSEEAAPSEAGAVDDSIVRGLSWDLVAGGVPAEGALAEASLGFSGLPRLGYHMSLSPVMSVGGVVSFDYAYWAPKAAFSGSLLIQGAIRYQLLRDGGLSIGLRAEPGIGLLFDQGGGDFAFGILLNVSGSAGFTLENRFIVGGGIDLPAALLISSRTAFVMPILVGPVFEFHVTPPLAITFDLKFGPWLNSAGGTLFGLKMMAGIAYRM